MLQLRKPYALLLVILTVISVYYSAIFAEILTIDDQKMITGLLNLDDFSLKNIFFPGGAYYYRPLLILSFIADNYFWGAHESFMHLENVLLHAANASFVYLLASKITRIQGSKSTAIPLVAALLFALHPIATEPVNWISGRTDLIAGLFVLISCNLLLVSLESGSKTALIGSAFSFLISPLAKETAIFWYPATMFLIYAVSRKKELSFPRELIKSIRSHGIYYLAMTSAPVGYFALRHIATKKHDSGIGLALKGVVESESFDILNKVRISFKVFGFYLKKLVFPLPLNFTILSASNWYVILGIIGIFLCLYLCYRRDILSALLLMSACIISPALLVPLGSMALTPIAERYLYMPAAFFSVAAVIYGANFLQRSRLSSKIPVSLAALLLLFCGYATYTRNIVWQKNLTLFQDCVDQNPDYVIVRNELATALRNAKRNAEADRIILGNKLPTSDKYSVATDINQALTLSKNNDLKGAVALLKKTDCPDSHPFYQNYLQSLMYLNDRLIANSDDIRIQKSLMRENLELMIRFQRVTGDPYGFYSVGKIAMTVGETKLAIENFRLAVEKSPPKAFYKEPARKLAERLGRELEKN